MSLLPKKPRSAGSCGAAAGTVLRGTVTHNRGVRLRVLQDHPRGDGGPLKGGFVLLDAGDNAHSALLAPLVGRATTADEVLRIIRGRSPCCVNVANANILVPEETSAVDRNHANGRPLTAEGTIAKPDF